MKNLKEENEQLDILNTILNNDNAFNTYINSIEKDIDIKTPDNLENNILSYINNSKAKTIEKTKSKIKKFKPIDILKIAACTILSVLLWQTMSLPPESVMANNEEPKTYFTINTSDFYRKINQFMFKQINIERGENQ